MDRLIGIAKLAAESPQLEAKRQVAYFELPTRSYVAKVASDQVPFGWMINPYRGCEFGCKYCYARYTHEFMELRQPGQFEQKIFAKAFEIQKFREEVKRLPRGATIAIGTATDPYQPAERRFFIMRKMLEVLATTAGLNLWITTKSDLVARDADVLLEVSRRHFLTVSLTITTLDTPLARLLEPMAPRPDLRLSAVHALTLAGLRTSVGCSPILPLINDGEDELDTIARAAAAAGAVRMGANILFLKPCARQVFLPFLEQNFPALVRRYRERYEQHAYLRGAYPEMIRERIAKIRLRYWPHPSVQPEPEFWPHDPQMELFPMAEQRAVGQDRP